MNKSAYKYCKEKQDSLIKDYKLKELGTSKAQDIPLKQ